MTKEKITFMTKEVRLVYESIWEARTPRESDEPKYSACLAIDKSDKETLARFKAAEQKAIELGIKTKWNGRRPAKIESPLHDGDENKSDREEYRGKYYINVKNKFKPIIIDALRNPITDESQVYSGCYVQASVSMFPYLSNGKSGIGLGLDVIVKRRDGDRLSGTTIDINSLEIDPVDDMDLDDLL